MTVDDFISQNYEWLLDSAKNIVRKSRRGKRKKAWEEDSVELVQLLSLFLLESTSQPDNLHGYSLMWMKQQVNWVGTNYKAVTTISSNGEMLEDRPAEQDNAPDVDDDGGRISHLVGMGFSVSQANNIDMAMDARFSSVLTEPEKALFDMMFGEELMSLREVGRVCDIPSSSVKRIFDGMKKKILEHIERSN